TARRCIRWRCTSWRRRSLPAIRATAGRPLRSNGGGFIDADPQRTVAAAFRGRSAWRLQSAEEAPVASGGRLHANRERRTARRPAGRAGNRRQRAATRARPVRPGRAHAASRAALALRQPFAVQGAGPYLPGDGIGRWLRRARRRVLVRQEVPRAAHVEFRT